MRLDPFIKHEILDGSFDTLLPFRLASELFKIYLVLTCLFVLVPEASFIHVEGGG